MELVLIRLARGLDSPPADPSPEVAADILWAAAVPDDQLEHVRARCGPGPGVIDLALFHRTDGIDSARDTATTLCRRATATAPALNGWVVLQLGLATDSDPMGAHHERDLP